MSRKTLRALVIALVAAGSTMTLRADQQSKVPGHVDFRTSQLPPPLPVLRMTHHGLSEARVFNSPVRPRTVIHPAPGLEGAFMRGLRLIPPHDCVNAVDPVGGHWRRADRNGRSAVIRPVGPCR